ncbi:MAG: putative toxin-antitoxin system toxin component, PIN family [DPANN group archaeon]|nr:putative toxin-antitoxin system toxin component, PIN family [DPANN group archaeon]
MRVVLYTNVLISAFGWPGGNEYQIVHKCFKKEVELVCSPEIIEEFEQVALRPKFEFSVEEIDEFISALLEIANVVQPDEHFSAVIQDPTDNKFLDAAVAGKAQFIVSGDKHLLNIKEFRGVKIITPAEFVKVLSGMK